MAEKTSGATEDEVARRIVAVVRARIETIRGLGHADRADAVQQATARVLEAYRNGNVTNLDAYSKRVAFHCAIDIIRNRKRERLESADAPPSSERPVVALEPGLDNQPSPESLLHERHRQEALTKLGPALRALIEAAPANYNQVLQHLYLEGGSLEDLVQQELNRRIKDGALPAASRESSQEYRRAQAAVHAWHSRALRWLKARALETWNEALRT